jgi:hypothetical protein
MTDRSFADTGRGSVLLFLDGYHFYSFVLVLFFVSAEARTETVKQTACSRDTMSYLVEIGRETLAYSKRQTSPQAFFAATPQPSISDAWRQNPKQKNMDYEAIKNDFKELIEEAKQTTHGRVETVLEPLREAMIEARREGVKLIKLYENLTKRGVTISPSSFAKYSQKHLQMKKNKGRQQPIPPVTPKVTQPVKHENVKAKESIQATKPTAEKPRIATGDY